MTNKNKATIKGQAKFCNTLMSRLSAAIVQNKELNDSAKLDYHYAAISGHTQLQDDIIKLRRELNELRKMLDCEYFENS